MNRLTPFALAAFLAAPFGLAGCGGSTVPAGPSTPPSTLTVSCGSKNAGVSEGLVVAAVIDPARLSDVVLSVQGAGPAGTMTCKAGERLCIAAFPEIPAWAPYRGEWGTTGWTTSVAGDVGRGLEAKACTQSGADTVLPQPEGSAELVSGQIRVTWKPVTGAATYVATLRDLGPPGISPQRTLGTVPTSGTQASFTLSGSTPALAVVEVEAWATDPGAPLTGSLPQGGANRSVRAIPVVGAPWALKQPSDFAADKLNLLIPAGSRMAVILLNVAGRDQASATVQATGTAVLAAQASQVSRDNQPLAWRPGNVPVTRDAVDLLARSGVVARAGLAAPATSTTFCAGRFDAAGNYLGYQRRPATLVRETTTGLFYVDDADAAEFTASDWDALASGWTDVYASVTGSTGPPPDVDGNGKVIVFFTDLGGFAMAVDIGSDEEHPVPDSSPNCSGTGSNHADIIYIHSLGGLGVSAEAGRAEVESWFTGGLQILVDFNRFDLLRSPGYEPEFWLWLVGRAGLAQTVAGLGYHLASLRASNLAVFQRTDPSGGQEGYPRMPMLSYPGTATNWGGENTFLLYLADRLGPDFVRMFFEEGTGVLQIEAISGIPFPIAYALWTSALLFSNEPASPWSVFDYTGPDWTPLHQKFQRFEYAQLNSGAAIPVTLVANGFDVYVTGPAGTAGGTVTVTSSEAVKPYVVAIPFTGTLP